MLNRHLCNIKSNQIISNRYTFCRPKYNLLWYCITLQQFQNAEFSVIIVGNLRYLLHQKYLLRECTFEFLVNKIVRLAKQNFTLPVPLQCLFVIQVLLHNRQVFVF